MLFMNSAWFQCPLWCWVLDGTKWWCNRWCIPKQEKTGEWHCQWQCNWEGNDSPSSLQTCGQNWLLDLDQACFVGGWQQWESGKPQCHPCLHFLQWINWFIVGSCECKEECHSWMSSCHPRFWAFAERAQWWWEKSFSGEPVWQKWEHISLFSMLTWKSGHNLGHEKPKSMNRMSWNHEQSVLKSWTITWRWQENTVCWSVKCWTFGV